jgi:hypothetical protein
MALSGGRWRRTPAPKPDRVRSSPAEVENGAGRERFGTVRGCPLGTVQDWYEWRASGKTGEVDPAHGGAVGFQLNRTGGQSSVTTASLPSRERGVAASSGPIAHGGS